MKAYVAVQKKLLTLCYAIWRNGAEYDPMYYVNNAKELKGMDGCETIKKIVPAGGTTARAAPTGCVGLKADTPVTVQIY